MRTSASRLAALALGLAAIAVGGWFAWQRWSGGSSRADALVRVEEALGGAHPVALASVDLEALRPLLGPAGPSVESALLRAAGAGDATAGQASRVFVALSRAGDGIGRVAVLLGQFDVDALEASLAETAAGGIEQAAGGGGRVLWIDRVDPESCRVTRIGVALAPERVVIAGSAELEALLARLGDAGLGLPSSADDGPLLAVRWSAGLELPGSASDPALRALVEALRGRIGSETALRASLRRARKSLALEVELAAPDGAHAGLLERVRSEAGAEGGAWLHGAPSLERWWSALAWNEEDPAALRARASVGIDAAPLSRVADDVLVLAAHAFQAASYAADAVPEPWPTSFREIQPLAAIPAYSKDMPLAGKADATAGPFGIRVERVRAADGLEIELRAVGPAVANLPAPDASPRLVIERVEDASGAELLAHGACGLARSGIAQPLVRSTPALVVEALKPLRLRTGTGLDAVASIRGRVELDLPTRTQTARSDAVAPGVQLEGPPGVAVEIVATSPIGFAYRVSGDAAGVLHVRGLDTSGVPLAGRQSWQAVLPGTGERVGALRYSGALASVEAIFALERQHVSWPFELESARPGSDGEAMHVESSSFIDYSAEQYDREFGAVAADPAAKRKGFAAVASAGPFQVGVGELVDDSGAVAPALTVIAPDIPNLSYNAGALELELERLVLRDARGFSPAVRVPVAPGHRFGNLDLEAQVRPATQVAAAPAEVESLSGELVLRLPGRVDALELAPVDPGSQVAGEGVAFALTELLRDGFALRMQGPLERFFSARAFADDGHELSVRRLSIGTEDADGARELRFRVQGQPRRLQIQLARDAALRRYAFELHLPAPEPPPAAPQP